MPYIQKIKIPGQEEAYPIKAEAVVDDINLGGEPTATTPDDDDVSTRIATTQFVDNNKLKAEVDDYTLRFFTGE